MTSDENKRPDIGAAGNAVCLRQYEESNALAFTPSLLQPTAARAGSAQTVEVWTAVFYCDQTLYEPKLQRSAKKRNMP